jgi:hypothetical protein
MKNENLKKIERKVVKNHNFFFMTDVETVIKRDFTATREKLEKVKYIS